MKNRFFCITMALLCAAQQAVVSVSALAMPSLSGKTLQIPPEYGITKEVSEEQPSTGNKGQMIIHLQDAHCNYEAQKNMAKVLDYLVKEHNLRLIMVEGGSGNVSLSFLRGYVDKELREKIADKYLKMGKISGEEYLDLVSDYNLELYGIEDKGLYDAHLAAFLKVDAIKNEGLRYLQGLSAIVEALKPYIYSESLKEWEQKKTDYEAKAISLAEYCRYLQGAALVQGFNLDDYYHIASFAETAKLEKEVDFNQAESERNAFVKDLANLVDEGTMDELLKKSQEFKAGEITPYRYYSFLSSASEQKLDLEHNYPHLYAYIKYLTVSGDTNSLDILKEIDFVAQKLKESHSVNDDQRSLSDISKSLQIVSMFLNIELTPGDYEYFKDNRSKFSTASWVNFLNGKCRNYNLTSEAALSQVIADNLGQLEEFYQLGVEREKSFMSNLAHKMSESGEKIAVLITGGFHTAGVSQMLKEQGYSYMVVAPVITQKSDSSIYFSVLRGGSGLDYQSERDEE